MGNVPPIELLKERVKNDISLADNIFFHDYPKTEQVGTLISSADIGLCHIKTKILAHKITFANKFFEYSLAELPVVSTKQDVCVSYGNNFKHAIL